MFLLRMRPGPALSPRPRPRSVPAVPPDSASSPPSSPLRGSEYAMLSRQIRQARLLDRRLRYYAAKIAVTAAALVAGWAAFALIGDSWWQLGIAVFLAVMFAQLGFLGHDAGHQQIFRVPEGQLPPRRGVRESRHRPELRLVDQQAQPASRSPQHRGRRPRHHDRCAGVLRRPGAGRPGGAAAGLPLPGVPVVPDDVPGGGQPARRQPSFGDAPDPRAPAASTGCGRQRCSRCMPPVTSPRSSSCCRPSGPCCSSWCSRACSASTWPARLPPTTRECPSWRQETVPISSAARS